MPNRRAVHKLIVSDKSTKSEAKKKKRTTPKEINTILAKSHEKKAKQVNKDDDNRGPGVGERGVWGC